MKSLLGAASSRRSRSPPAPRTRCRCRKRSCSPAGRRPGHRARGRRDHDELRPRAGHREAVAVHRDGHRLVRGRPRVAGDERPRRGSRAPPAGVGRARAEEEGDRPGLRRAGAARPGADARPAARPRGPDPPRRQRPRARQRAGRAVPAAHRAALQRDVAQGRGQEVQRAAQSRRQRQAAARLRPGPRDAPRAGRHLSGHRAGHPRFPDRRPRAHPRLSRRRAPTSC